MVRRAEGAACGGRSEFRTRNADARPIDGNTAGRSIPRDHVYDPRALKPLAKSLWAASVGLGHALTAYRHFSRLKSATISPDGALGGRGYVMSVRDVRQRLYAACEALSAVADTLFDELNGPHWKPKLSMLDENEAEDVERFVEESRQNVEHPDGRAEEEIQSIEAENDDAHRSDSNLTVRRQDAVEDPPGARRKHASYSYDRSQAPAANTRTYRGADSDRSPASGLPGPSQNQEERLNSLPNDGSEPVSRSDYYPGDKGNLVNAKLVRASDMRHGATYDRRSSPDRHSSIFCRQKGE